MKSVIWAALAVALATTSDAQMAMGAGDTLSEMLNEPMPRVPEALGDYSRPISSNVAEAQAYFDQGMQLMYAFGKPEAIRSFREAWKRDPGCAICYWGEAWSWGSYLNAAMSTEEAPHAYAAVQKALALKDRASPVERALIDALAVRYVPDYELQSRRIQDEDYAVAMGEVVAAFPNDLDVATLHADALFLLEERRGYRDIEHPRIAHIRGLLEGILDRDIQHIGACHLYIHLTEATTKPELAEACAAHLGTAVPGASHLNHMPSHTWNEVGRWNDGVRANLEAWHSDLKAASGKGVAIYPMHNLHMLLFAASYDGQGGIAMRAAKDYTKLMSDNSLESLVLLRFGRFDEVLELGAPAAGDYPAGVWEFAQGYARLRQNEPEFAEAHLTRLARLAGTTRARVRFDAAADLLKVLEELLRGEIRRSEGDHNRAMAAFTRAVEQEDQLNYDEPEIFPFAARHWLGAALLERGRAADAERIYREELEDHPHNGWSLFGLKQALAALGRVDSAVDADFDASWARSDVWIEASRF